MIKGVNRQIIEVHDTGCRYFERAFFFVSAEYAGMQRKALQNEAERVVKTYIPSAYRGKKNKKTGRMAACGFCFFGGAALCLLVIGMLRIL